MFFSFLLTLKRDLILVRRHPMQFLNPLLFFVLVTLLFPFAMTSDPQKLMQIGPGVIWIALLLANMLAIENLFTSDYDDGTLEQMVLQTQPLTLFVLAKIIAHWVSMILPLVVSSLLLSKLFFLNNHTIVVLALSLLLGSPVLSLVGAIGSALTLSLQSRGLVLVLMVLPLYLPVLIFGAGAVNDANLFLPVTSQLSFLGAFLSLSLTFAPWAIASALNVSIE